MLTIKLKIQLEAVAIVSEARSSYLSSSYSSLTESICGRSNAQRSDFRWV